MRSPRRSFVLAIVGAILLLAGTTWLGLDRWQEQRGATVISTGTRPTSSAPPLASEPGSGTAGPSVPAEPPTERIPAPRALRIPVIDVATRVVPVGLEPDGALGIPDDVRLVGWYRLGVPPGADHGSAVLVAHRDGRGQGRGAFYDLGRLDVGDDVTVRTASGDRLAYRVVARESFRKTRLPYEELFTASGPPRLTLISCGGAYDPDRGGYRDNVVVTAVPAFSVGTENPATVHS